MDFSFIISAWGIILTYGAAIAGGFSIGFGQELGKYYLHQILIKRLKKFRKSIKNEK